jgi:hypothetical protein
MCDIWKRDDTRSAASDTASTHGDVGFHFGVVTCALVAGGFESTQQDATASSQIDRRTAPCYSK